MVWILKFKLSITYDDRSMNMRIKKIMTVLTIAAIISWTAVSAQSRVVLSSFNSGFAQSNDGTSVLFSVTGQSVGGVMVGAGVTLSSGNSAFARIHEVLTDVKKRDELAPRVFSLSQNYPNPFNPTTTLRFTVPQKGRVVVKVYNVIGQEVATIFNDNVEAGVFQYARFNGQRLASGMYIARLEFHPSNTASGSPRQLLKKMLLVK